jgi:hypothetical protein
MATETAKTDTKTKPAANGGAKSRFTKVVTDRPMYRVEKCAGKALVGHLLGLGAMPEAEVSAADRANGRTGAWNAYIVLTTEVTLACPVGSKIPEETPVGTEVMIGESAKLSELRKHLHPDKIFEVSIKPVEKIALTGGKSMWLFDIGCDFEHPQPRPAQYALAHAGLPPTKQMTAAASTNDGDEIPF